jgi:hypothetical protein
MKNNKFDLVINYKDDQTRISVNKDSEFDKLVKLIKLVFEGLENIGFELRYNEKDLLKEFSNQKLNEVFVNNESLEGKNDGVNSSNQAINYRFH